MFKNLYFYCSFAILFANVAFAQKSPKHDIDVEKVEKTQIKINCQCAEEIGFPVSEQYATLEKRAMGSPLLDENGERVIWPRRLPFFAQNVLDLGFELPKTFGLAIIPNTAQQDLVLKIYK